MSHQPGTHLSDSAIYLRVGELRFPADLFAGWFYTWFLNASVRSQVFSWPMFCQTLGGWQIWWFARKPSFGLCCKAWVYYIAQRCCDWSELCIATRWELAQHGAGPRKLCRMINVLMDMVHEFRFVQGVMRFAWYTCAWFSHIIFCIVFTVYHLPSAVGLNCWFLETCQKCLFGVCIIWPAVFFIYGYADGRTENMVL